MARPISFKDFPKEEALSHIATVEGAFGKKWLDSPIGSHRVQKIWKREDNLASRELVSFGSALSITNGIDAVWTKDQITEVKKNDENSHGPLFEIFTIAALKRAGMPVIPTRGKAPGIDAVVNFGEMKIRLSFKNYGLSKGEQRFREQSMLTRKALNEFFRKHAIAHQVLLEAEQALTPPDWERIRMELAKAPPPTSEIQSLSLASGKAKLQYNIPLPFSGHGPFNSRFHSDTFLCVSVQQTNEQKRFHDKVYEAVNNVKGQATRSIDTVTGIFIRLHTSASMAQLMEYAASLLSDISEVADAIFLYQPAVVRNVNNESVITHHVCVVASDRWKPIQRTLKMAHLFGKFSAEPYYHRLQRLNGEILRVEDKYVFQVGDHYCSMRQTAPGQWDGNSTSVAPGLRIHSVAPPEFGNIPLSGRFPSEEEVALL